MAIEILSRNGEFEKKQRQRMEFQIETLEEINNLPTQTINKNNMFAGTGSIALCEEDWSIWILTIKGEWKPMYGQESE